MPRRTTFLAALALSCFVAAVFHPVPGFEFIDYDVNTQVVRNPHIRGLSAENLGHIFTSRCIQSYYPVRTLSHAVDFQIWGLDPYGFKLTNVLIHWGNALLVFWLTLRLFGETAVPPDNARRARFDAALAAFATGIFAIHPVVVETVVWVAGREELLMTLGALACFHFHLCARRLGAEGRRRGALAYHVGAAGGCAFACLSSAVGAVIPAVIVAWDALTLSKPSGQKILYGTAALWVIGAVTILVKYLGRDPESRIVEVGLFSMRRVMLVFSVYWTNLQSLAWPDELAIYYWPTTPESFFEKEVILGAVAVVLTCLILWKLRRRSLLFFGLLWFVLTLGPSAQVFPHHIHRADRFLYLPLVGVALATAMVLRPLEGRLTTPFRLTVAASVGAAVLLTLDVASSHWVRTWRDSLSVWENCVRVEPNNAFAHDTLATNLRKRGQWQRAAVHHERAMELDQTNHEALRDRALDLATATDERIRDFELAQQMAEQACALTGWKDPRYLRTLATVHGCRAATQASQGQFSLAVENYSKALETDPRYDAALWNLAVLLSTCEDAGLRDPEQAVELAERACQLTDELDVHRLLILWGAYVEADRHEQAIAAAKRAARVAEATGDQEIVEGLRQWIRTNSQPHGPLR